jgi:hypothetical protein
MVVQAGCRYAEHHLRLLFRRRIHYPIIQLSNHAKHALRPSVFLLWQAGANPDTISLRIALHILNNGMYP